MPTQAAREAARKAAQPHREAAQRAYVSVYNAAKTERRRELNARNKQAIMTTKDRIKQAADADVSMAARLRYLCQIEGSGIPLPVSALSPQQQRANRLVCLEREIETLERVKKALREEYDEHERRDLAAKRAAKQAALPRPAKAPARFD